MTVLSYDYWRTHLGAARDVIGQTILLNGHSFTIIGVAPSGFDSAIGGYRPSVFVPTSMVDIAIPWRAPLDDLNNHKSVMAHARCASETRRHASAGGSQHETALAFPAHLRTHSSQVEVRSASARTFSTTHYIQSRRRLQGIQPQPQRPQKPLVILFSMACLLVVCAPSMWPLCCCCALPMRAREMSMRYALGARRGRIVSQLMVEGGVLGLTGAVAGILLAPMVTTASGAHSHKLRSRNRTLFEPRSTAGYCSSRWESRCSPRCSLASPLSSTSSALIWPVHCGKIPELCRRSRSASARSLSGMQIALSVLLLGGAGLFLRTLDNLRHQSIGFETANLVTFSLESREFGIRRRSHRPNRHRMRLRHCVEFQASKLSRPEQRSGIGGRYRDFKLLCAGIQACRR